MSRIIAGQVRILDESSRQDSMFVQRGNGRGVLKGIIPDMKIHMQPNLKKDASMRGRGQGMKGDVDKRGSDLHMKSSFTDPWMHFSVGGQLLKEHAKDLDKARVLLRKGKRAIIHPERMGKKHAAGISVPHRKQPAPPTKGSDIIKKQAKRVHRQVKKLAKGKRARHKLDLSNPSHNSEHLKQ